MTLSSTQALDLLQANPSDYATPDALQALVNQISVEASGQVTVLHSGSPARCCWTSHRAP
jgi:hypothetical protein